eukprot:9921207-Alexandrium_andersonii.AAC.1
MEKLPVCTQSTLYGKSCIWQWHGWCELCTLGGPVGLATLQPESSNASRHVRGHVFSPKGADTYNGAVSSTTQWTWPWPKPQ